MEHEIQAAQRKLFGKKYCLHPNASPQNCKGNIVRAHTVQRGGGLTRIAKDGHVYSGAYNKATPSNPRRHFGAELIGINLASTFTGFCGFHDNQTFLPIEDHPFLSNQQHTFLLGYRAICKEVFLKRVTLEIVPLYRTMDKGESIFEQLLMQRGVSAWETGIKLALREIEPQKINYDQALIRADYFGEQYYVVRFDKTPDILCSGAVQPDYDFEGNLLQDWTDKSAILDHITFSLITTDSGGAAVFSWLGNSDAARKLIKTLDSLPDAQLPHAIVRFTFENFENSYFSPSWWDGLSDDIKKRLLARQLTTLDTRRKSDCLKDDGIRTVSWSVTARDTNIVF